MEMLTANKQSREDKKQELSEVKEFRVAMLGVILEQEKVLSSSIPCWHLFD